ncbi:MAG: hypothetical protein FWD90_03680 [Defluviitaleaceae bacterium]|nr:hypothetical protein [Defluviitaleaceae bacterium]
MMDWLALIIIAAVPFALVSFAVIYFRDKKKSKQDIQQLLADKGALYMITLPHAAGLPLPEKVDCTIFYCVKNIEVNANGVAFKLDLDGIHDISVKSATEIHRQLVSSAGGAIAGAHLAGWVGAAIFGRVHERQITETRFFLFITYTSTDGISYIAFETDQNNKYTDMIIAEFGKRPKNTKAVSLT